MKTMTNDLQPSFGNIIRAARLGYSVFRVPVEDGQWLAFLRISPTPSDTFVLHFTHDLPKSVSGEHYCWWERTDGEGKISRQLFNRSAAIRAVVAGEHGDLPVLIVIDEEGEEVKP